MKYFIKGWHTQFRIWKPVSENRNDIKPLPLRLLNESILVFCISPDPFIPIKKKADGRPFRLVESLPIGRKIRHIPVLHTEMVESRPAEGTGIRWLYRGSLKEESAIEP